MDIIPKPSPFRTATRFLFKPSFIVVHWIDGTLSAADAVFTNPNTNPPRSAHYGVGGTQIHQYVPENYTAWHAGNWLANLQSIGIEHEGSYDIAIADETYDTSAQLIADIWRRNPSIKPVRSSLKRHNEIKTTSCPGNLDVDRLFNQAMTYYNPAPAPAPTPTPVDTPTPTPAPVQPTPPSAPANYVFNIDLQPGMVNEEVGKMQDRLVQLGYLDQSALSNGGRTHYGPRTQQAIIRFQIDHKIINSGTDYGAGYFGPHTRSVINSL